MYVCISHIYENQTNLFTKGTLNFHTYDIYD